MATDRRVARGVLRAAVLCLSLLAGPVSGQDAAPMPPEEILALTDEAEALMAEGDYDAAFAKLALANDATFTSDDYEDTVKHYPNLVFARYYIQRSDWAEAQRFATSVASAFDTPELISHPYRTEALLLQGIAFFRQGQGVQAEGPLFSAFRATENDPALAGLHVLASYFLAQLLTDMGSPEAEDYRYHFFSLDLDGSPVTVEDTAYLAFRHVSEARMAGADPNQSVADFETLMAMIEKQPSFNEIDYSYYRGYLGLLYAEAGRHAEALKLFTERHEYLAEKGPIDDDYFWNVQRRAMVTSILGDNEGARKFLTEQIEFGRTKGISTYMLAILYGDLGEFSDNLGQTSIAQMHYRNAYAQMRRLRRANDPEVLALKALINLNARDIKSFSFAPELGVVEDVDFALKPDASDAMRLFFEGRYLVLDALLDAREAEEGDTALFLVNRAMQQALIGDYDGCVVTTARARAAVMMDPAGPVAPGAPIIDLIDTLVRIWSTVHERKSARPILDRLNAKLPLLTPGERSLYLALEIFGDFQESSVTLIPGRFETFMADWHKAGNRDVLGLVAATLALEGAMGAVSVETIQELYDTTLAEIDAQGTMTLSRDYARMIRYLNHQSAIFDEDALTELGSLIREIAVRVPEDHAMISAAQFGMANALRWRGRPDEAFDWLEQATTTLRSNPYHARDTLAFLISEMAVVKGQLGDTTTAAALAREAYDMTDFATARHDLSSGVIEAYATTTWNRNGNAARAAEIYQRHVDDPAYFDRLAPLNQVRLLRAYADSLAGDGDAARVSALLDRAIEALSRDVRDTRPERSSIQWTRATSLYYASDYAAAFASIREANDVYEAWHDDQLAAGAFGDLGAAEAHARAVWEAAIGWEYALTLPE